MSITVCARRFSYEFGSGSIVTYEVLLDGHKYRCDSIQLEQLYAGVPVDELDLIEIEEEDE